MTSYGARITPVYLCSISLSRTVSTAPIAEFECVFRSQSRGALRGDRLVEP